MNRFARFLVIGSVSLIAASFGGCGGGGGGNTQTPTNPTVTVTPASNSISTTQSLVVAVTVAGVGGTPTGSVVLSSGNYTSAATTLTAGSASITIAAGSLVVGPNTLTAKYTPDAASSATFNSASGTAAAPVTVTLPATPVTVTINTLANRHTISPFVYGGNLSNATNVADSGTTLGRWGGNASSTYNWILHTYNADNDYYFEDYLTDGGAADGDSVQFVKDIQNAGGFPLTTMATLGWAAQSPENGSNGHWSFSVKTFGPQCSVDQYNTDAGNGEVAGGTPASCNTSVPVTTVPQTSEAYYPMVDTAADCPG